MGIGSAEKEPQGKGHREAVALSLAVREAPGRL